jgi:PAS domain-containing protein
MDAMVDGVVVSSAIRDEAGRIVDFRFVYANANIGTISGIPADSQIIEHTLLEMFPAHRTNGLFEAYVGVVETGVAFESLDRDLSVAPLSAGGPLDKYVDQHVAKLGDGYVLSVRDVTTRHRAEAHRRRRDADHLRERGPRGEVRRGTGRPRGASGTRGAGRNPRGARARVHP